MRRERFHVVSVNREHDLLLTALAWRIAFPLRKPGRLMMSYHTATSRKQILLGTVDGIVCISEHVRTKLISGNSNAASKITLCYYGIEMPDAPGTDKFDIHRKRRFFSGADFPLVGMVGEFWKNQSELVEMIPEFKKSYPGIKVALVGDDSDRNLVDPLRSRIRELGAEENVVFTGRVARDRIPDIFYDFDISLTTHRNEGFGIVHLESLAAGTPVIAYNEGGFVDIFRGEDAGVLVDAGPAEFASAVADLLRDHDRRFAMGRAGYDLVNRRFSVRTMGKAYLEFYRDLVGR